MRQLVAFFQLSRPFFLGGAVLTYALGVLLAWSEGVDIRWDVWVLGQAAVTGIQLMTHYLNELADVETDAANEHRTWFSGGSAVIAAGVLSPTIARVAIGVTLITGVLAGATALAVSGAWTGAGPIFALIVFLAWSYSGPPLRLASSGMGELGAGVVVALLVPALGYALQAGMPTASLVATCIPLVALCWAMIVAFEFPDHDADAATGKRTLLVRLGHRRTALLCGVVVAAAFLWLAGLAVRSRSTTALLPLLGAPVAVAMGAVIWRLRDGRSSLRYDLLAFGAVLLFGLPATLTVVAVWMAG